MASARERSRDTGRERTGIANEQRRGTVWRGEDTKAALVTEPWAREVPRNWTTGKEGAKGMNSAVPDAGVSVAAAGARNAQVHAERALLHDYLAPPRECLASEITRVVRFRECCPVKGREVTC
jgi:hypothetical protein